MSNRLLIGLVAAGFALSLSEACNHAGGNGSTGTAGTGSGSAGTGSGQAGTGPGNAGTSGEAGTFGAGVVFAAALATLGLKTSKAGGYAVPVPKTYSGIFSRFAPPD